MHEIADLCAGIGGFHLAFKKLKINASVACEIDEFAQRTYLHNFPETLMKPDITKMSGSDLNGADILCAGFPCQAFSIAGYRKGFEDVRGTIFFDIVRIASEAEPEALFLENVENLSRHDNGQTFSVILSTLKDMGYHVMSTVLDSRNFGMYQMRRRTIIVCFKDKAAYSRFSFNLPKSKPPRTFAHLLDEFEGIDEEYFLYDDSWLAVNFIDMIKNGNNPEYIYQFRRHYWREYIGRCPTLTANMGTGGHNVPFIYDSRGPPPAKHISYRKLTPMETFRLQGFGTEGFEFSLPRSMSNSRLYKQAGNSVPVPMIYQVARQIVNALDGLEEDPLGTGRTGPSP